MKRLLHSHYLDKPMNIALILSCLVIIIIQAYFMLDTWLSQNLSILYAFITNNNLLLAIVTGLIPLLPSIIVYIGKKIKNRNVDDGIVVSSGYEKTKVFPGAITYELIRDKKVMLVSERKLETVGNNKPMVLDRKIQCELIRKYIEKLKKNSKKNQLNCLYLTGNSGAGKSILLKSFLKGDGKFQFLYFNDYSSTCDLIYKEIFESKVDVIIMDQFETSLEYTDIYENIRRLIKNLDRSLVFVFVFPQHVFEHIVLNVTKNILNGKGKLFSADEKYNSKYYFLGCDEYDIKELKILINTFLKTGMGLVNECLNVCEDTLIKNGSFLSVLNSEKYPVSLVFLCSILARIDTGRSPLAEFSMVSYIYELFKEDIDYNVSKYIDDLGEIFKLYFDNWTNKFPNHETGKLILQLISNGKKYNVDDLKCITFEPRETFEILQENDEDIKERNMRSKREKGGTGNNNIRKENVKPRSRKHFTFNIVMLLKQNQFIQVKENYIGFKFGIFAIHDYIALKMNEYCFENLDNKLRQNVDHYKKRMIEANHGHSVMAESKEKLQILKRYNQFFSRRDLIFINILVYILMIGSIIISSIQGYQMQSNSEHIYYMFISAGCFLSTYYMYNIVMQFLRMLMRRYYYPLSIWGIILMLLCFVFPDYWGVFAGIEVVILGVSLYSIHKITINLAVDFFKEKGVFYIFLGMVVIAFGVLYAYSADSIQVRFILSFFFFVYVIASDVSHINYSYIMNKVGMGNTI